MESLLKNMATAQCDAFQVYYGPGFPNGRYESADTRSSLSSVDQYLPRPGNHVDPYDASGASYVSVNTGRSRSRENYVDAVPSNTPPLPSAQSYSHCPRQSVKRRSQSQGKPGQAAAILPPRMKHSILATFSQISLRDVKIIMSIICILVGIFMATSLWDTVTLPQPGTYIWFLAPSVAIAYMFYLLFHGDKREGSKSYQDRRDDPLPTNRLNLIGLGHPDSWDSRHIKQFFRQNPSFLGKRLNEILALLDSEKFDIRGKELLNPNLVNEEYLKSDMNITNSISRHRLMEPINLLREKFNTSTNRDGGNVRNIKAHTLFLDQSQQHNHGCNQSFSVPVPVKRAEQDTSV